MEAFGYIIYGAQALALGTYNSIKIIFPEKDILCFVVTKREGNPFFISGLPVWELEKAAAHYPEKEKLQVLIATPENMMYDIEQNLECYGFYNYVRIDSKRWALMQKNAFIREKSFAPLELYPAGSTRSRVYIYKAKFYKDKNLRTKTMEPDYIVPIQVGSSQTGIRIADVLDSEGDNISDKNGNYSELTGLYWVWKHRVANHYYGNKCYYGLVHYRRLFELSDDDLYRLQEHDIDVVLPYPMPYEPDIGEHHKRYLSDSEWSAVWQALEELQPAYALALKDILKQKYFYNYNMIIAKSKVLEKYCSWLFPILFRIEEINDPDKEKKPNRYLGYVGETLETLYFMYNKDNLRITHTGCRFLI